MPSHSQYTITTSLAQGRGIRIYRAVRNVDRLPVVLKVLDPARGRAEDLECLKHEYDIGKILDSRSVVKPLALETHRGLPTLVLEDSGGESLDHLLGAPMGIERFLRLAIGITAAVTDVHRQEIIHQDLKPQNILVNPGNDEVKVTDFGVASRLPREHRPARPPRLIKGSLPYLSPEQTGRTNRALDSRTDLYSLGITFYQMLTGRLPFEARDPVEWIHCHVARAPPSPSEIVLEVPEMIAGLVLKLLSKMPEDRYQSARGLQLDLELCLEQWSKSGKIEPFAPGERAVTDRIQIPQKLHGREAEIALLLQAFCRVAATGTPELLLVSGYSGIGKSSLVQELYRPIVRERAFFLSGKFDQYKHDIPYATVAQAFRELVLEILAESEPRIAVWRQRLLGALGVNGQLIVDMIPPIELVIGRQPPVPELPPSEAQSRFLIVLRQFVGVFAQKEHPLALFLDDLQWADLASLGLLEELVAHPDMRHLLIVGAYRDNEVTATHPLLLTLNEVRKLGVRVSNIVLGPIAPEQLARFVSEALHCRLEEAAPLAELVHEKTAGNPFFAIQFLTALHEERLIELDGRAGAFRWDVAKIRAKAFTDNVVDLMIGKLRRLPRATQSALQQLACLGNSAELAVLTMVHGVSEEETHADLWEVARAGLVLRLDDRYKFLHDRVQEAAYSLIPEGERATAHLEIGRMLLAHEAPEELEEKIFEIVNQLDRGAALLSSREERERVAELNLVAGKRAKGSTAYASALKYLTAGSALLEEDSWDRRYELTFALALSRAECEYLTGDLTASEARLSMLSRRARGLVDSAAVTCVRLDAASRAEPLLWTSPSFFVVAEYHFYGALALAAHHDTAPADERPRHLEALVAHHRQLEAWAKNCPENFEDRATLVGAEVARIEGRDLEAMRLYEQAIRAARENSFVHHEAVAFETAARFYQARGFDRIADVYLREARSCYVRWGANGKVQSLDRLRPDLVEKPSSASTSTFVGTPEQLDLLSLVKALQSISSEIVLPRLAGTLLQIMLQQAGGQRGALILVRDGELAVQAEASTDGKEIRVQSLRGVLASSEAFPMSILQYVARTGEAVILNDTAASARFASDEHLVRRRPRSLLCLPIVRQARVSGLVYLENNLATGAFNADTIHVLELLGAQAAISLDNATLYADLERSRMEIAAVLDNMVDGVFVVDRAARVTLVNNAAARLTGFASPAEMRGPMANLARRMSYEHQDGAPCEGRLVPILRALGGETVPLDEGRISLPGAERTRYVHTSASPMRDDRGEVVGAVAVARDVTELVELDRLKDQFLRVAAHELKTPVAVVMGYAETLSRTAKELAPGQRRMLDGLLRGARRIDRIVADLLFLSQIQLDRLHLVVERLDLGELVDRVAARQRLGAPQRCIRVTCAEPVVLEGDRELLERIMAHLIDNALRYSPDGGDVEVNVRIADAQNAIVSVRDHGVGIPAGERSRIFECFHRAHTDTPHDYGGMGTGLYLSRSVVARHGGEMYFESEEGRGSTFYISLPLGLRGTTAPS